MVKSVVILLNAVVVVMVPELVKIPLDIIRADVYELAPAILMVPALVVKAPMVIDVPPVAE